MKPYRKPTLEKKQVLSTVTAFNGGGSGVGDNGGGPNGGVGAA